MENTVSNIDIVNGKLYIDGQCVEIQVDTEAANELSQSIVNSTEIAEGSTSSTTLDTISSGSSKNQCDEDKLYKILSLFNLLEVLPNLKASKITYRSLKYLSKEDINIAIPDIGPRAIFREKLFAWRKTEYGLDDDTLSTNSKINQWMKDNNNIPNFSPSTPFKTIKVDILEILNETPVGKNLIKYYELGNSLTNNHRNELIRIIIEYTNFNEIRLKPADFPYLVDQIISIFPLEEKVKGYYYIPRQGKKNPSGKLYCKYSNSRCKRLKSNGDTSNTSDNFTQITIPSAIQNTSDETIEFDESISLAIKTALQREINNWEEVKDKWQKSFQIRQKDFHNMSIVDFLKAWPKFIHSQAPDLIEIDFELIYPGKKLLLFSKWIIFKNKINSYYERNINNVACKELLNISKTVTNCDTQDYICTTLLNSILLPTARFKDRASGNKRKATIADGQESFILQLECINDYQRKLAELTSKYYYSGLTIQPLLIVEGSVSSLVKNFYVYFDGTLYKFPSFISSLDICFKIFQIFQLKYPKACELPWNFIQQYFFNIYTTYDIKSANLVSLISHMES